VNINGTEEVLSAAFSHQKKVVFSSTSEIYGRNTVVPFHEDSDRVLGSTQIDRWCYATSKATAEHFCFAFARMGLPVVVLRYFNVYGPRLDQMDRGRVVTIFMGQLLRGEDITVIGDGKQTRCFTYVSDTVEGTIRAATMAEAIGGVFNIGSDREISILELARMIKRDLASRSEIVLEPYETHYPKGFEDTRRRVPDVSKAQKTLGYVARVPLDVGLGRTLDWCRTTYRVSLAS